MANKNSCKGLRLMGSERIPRDEQIRLIQGCRNSGMSDSQWYLQHGIRPGTFYNWVNRIKKKGDIHIPSPGGTGEYFRRRNKISSGSIWYGKTAVPLQSRKSLNAELPCRILTRMFPHPFLS